MRHDDRRTFERVGGKASDALRHVLVALAGRWAEIPETGVAFAGYRHFARAELGVEPALVDAERHLDQPLVERHFGQRHTEARAHALHGLAGAAERRGVPGEIGRAAAGTLEDLHQQPAVEIGLAAADVVERDILTSLIPPLGIPVGFAVTDEVEFRPVEGHVDARKQLGPPCGSPGRNQAVGAAAAGSSSTCMPMMLKPQSTYCTWPVTPEARSLSK